jgi:hypothetical protein
MRRGRRVRTVYRKGKTIYRSRGGTGAFKPILTGAIAGAAGNFAGGFLGGFGKPIAHAGVGWFFKDKALMTIAGMEIGSMFLGGGGVMKSGGGFFES